MFRYLKSALVIKIQIGEFILNYFYRTSINQLNHNQRVTYTHYEINTPAYMAARRALNDSPELMEYDDRSVLELSREIARSLKIRIPDMDEEKLGIINTTIIDISDTMICRAHKYLHIRNDRNQASEIIMNLKLVLKSYLHNYLD